jgi:hypothetical protein
MGKRRFRNAKLSLDLAHGKPRLAGPDQELEDLQPVRVTKLGHAPRRVVEGYVSQGCGRSIMSAAGQTSALGSPIDRLPPFGGLRTECRLDVDPLHANIPQNFVAQRAEKKQIGAATPSSHQLIENVPDPVKHDRSSIEP